VNTENQYVVEVVADSSGKYYRNGLHFATVEEAEVYARNLWSRWTAVQKARIVLLSTHEFVKEIDL
jgi:hypothetical protein